MTILDNRRVDLFDSAFDAAAERLRGKPLADRIFYSLSESANHSLLWHAITWAGVPLGQRSIAQAARTSAAFGVESALVNGVIKRYFRRERPTAAVRPHRLRQPKTSSFPSGHATSALFALLVLGTKRTYLPLLLLALLVGWSRVHVKIHHGSDVVGGVVVGVFLGMVARRVLGTVNRLT